MRVAAAHPGLHRCAEGAPGGAAHEAQRGVQLVQRGLDECGALAGLLGLLSLAAGLAPVVDYICDQWVYHVPLAILATGLAVLAALSLCIGVILQTQLVYHNEMHRLVRKGFSR